MVVRPVPIIATTSASLAPRGMGCVDGPATTASSAYPPLA